MTNAADIYDEADFFLGEYTEHTPFRVYGRPDEYWSSPPVESIIHIVDDENYDEVSKMFWDGGSVQIHLDRSKADLESIKDALQEGIIRLVLPRG